MNWDAELWYYYLADDWVMIKKSEVFMQFIQNDKIIYWWNQIKEVDKQNKSFTNQNSSHLKLTHENSVIKKLLNKFNDVFSKKKAAFLADTTQISHLIQLINRMQLSFESLYNLLTNKLEILRKYLKEMQQYQWIWSFTSSAEALIFFVLKKNESFRLCIDY